jgi:hypothetical protein
LLTAKATIVNLETGSKLRARILLDTGSHQSFVVDRLTDDLKLAVPPKATIDLGGFACSTTTVDSAVVEVGIEEQNGNIRRIVANTTPVISSCSGRPSDVSNEDEKVLQSVCSLLADDIPSTGSGLDMGPDILVGADYFWDFIIGASLKTDTDLKLVPSTLGLLVGGRLKIREQNDAEHDYKSSLLIGNGMAVETASPIMALSEIESVADPIIDQMDEPGVTAIANWLLENDRRGHFEQSSLCVASICILVTLFLVFGFGIFLDLLMLPGCSIFNFGRLGGLPKLDGLGKHGKVRLGPCTESANLEYSAVRHLLWLRHGVKRASMWRINFLDSPAEAEISIEVDRSEWFSSENVYCEGESACSALLADGARE